MIYLTEKYGLITNPEQSFKFLVDIITKYIYDPKNGFSNNNDLYHYDEKSKQEYIEFNKYDIIGYYQLDHFIEDDNNIIPSWFNNFTIRLIQENDKNEKIAGYFSPSNSSISKDKSKLNNIFISISLNKKLTEEEVKECLMHEFRHAYDYYILKCKKNQEHKLLYSTNKVNDKATFKVDNNGHFIIDNKVYNNSSSCTNMYYNLFYYTDPKEINAYLESFNSTLNSSNNKELKKNEYFNLYKGFKEFLKYPEKIKPTIRKKLLENISNDVLSWYNFKYKDSYNKPIKDFELDTEPDSYLVFGYKVFKYYGKVLINKIIGKEHNDSLENLKRLNSIILTNIDYILKRMYQIFNENKNK